MEKGGSGERVGVAGAGSQEISVTKAEEPGGEVLGQGVMGALEATQRLDSLFYETREVTGCCRSTTHCGGSGEALRASWNAGGGALRSSTCA